MRQLACKGLALCLGLVSLPSLISLESTSLPESRYKNDPRVQILRKYFELRQSPLVDLAEDFVIAADRYHLDWRLLPAIAVIESGAGVAYKNNNIFGWNAAETFFPSVRAGIYYVASRLGKSPNYAGKAVYEKLQTYNPEEGYVELVTWIMRRIGPADPRHKLVAPAARFTDVASGKTQGSSSTEAVD